MRRAVLADRDAGVRGADVHVEVRVADVVANLLERAAGGEHRERGAEDLLAGGCDARGDADHVGLGDAAVVEAQVPSFVLVYLEKGDVLRVRLVDFLEKRHAEKLVTIVEIGSCLETDRFIA